MPILIRCSLQASIVVLQDRVVGIVRILFQYTHHRAWIDKARDIIDMTICIIAGNTLPQPDNMTYAQVVVQVTLEIAALQVRIAIGMEETLLGGQTTPLSIYVDRAPFENNTR